MNSFAAFPASRNFPEPEDPERAGFYRRMVRHTEVSPEGCWHGA